MSQPPPPPPPMAAGAETGQQQQVVTKQPRNFVLPDALKTSSAGAVPQGLEYLAQLDQVLLKQQMELIEVFTNIEMQNRYKIFNSMGQQIMFAQEESDPCHRQCCKANRGFTMHITDNNGTEIITLTREFKCCASFSCSKCFACCGGCQFEMAVEAGGAPIGYVKNLCSPCKPRFGVYDGDHELLCEITGPVCICNAPGCGDVEFPVITLDSNEEVGICAKQWSGLALEIFTTADHYNVRFPLDMDVKIKATLMAAILMIDFMYFEQAQGGRRGRRGGVVVGVH